MTKYVITAPDSDASESGPILVSPLSSESGTLLSLPRQVVTLSTRRQAAFPSQAPAGSPIIRVFQMINVYYLTNKPKWVEPTGKSP